MALQALACSNCGARLRVANTRLLTCEFCALSVVNPGFSPEAAATETPATKPVAPPAAAPAPATSPVPVAVAAPVAGPPNAGPRTTEELVGFIRGFLGLNDSLYYAPNIPPPKERNAREAYGTSMPAGEIFLAQFDGTVFGKGDDGFVLTPTFLAWSFMGSQVVPWRDISPDAVVVADDKINVLGQEVPLVPDEMVQPLAKLVRAIATMVRGPAAAPAPAPAKAAAVPAPAKAAAPKEDASWFVAIEGVQKGPLTTEQLRAMAASGDVNGGNYVWREGLAEWTPMSNIAELTPTKVASAKAAPTKLAPAKAGASKIASVKGPSAKIARSKVEEEEEETDGGWHVTVDDEELGPLSLEEVQQMFADGEIDAETLVWRDDLDDWTALEEVDELVEACAATRGSSTRPKRGAKSIQDGPQRMFKKR